MSKFKVGDKVRIVNPLHMCEKYRNTIHMVTDVDDTYAYLDIIDDDPYCVKYCDYELELVEELTFEYIDDYMDTSKRIVVDDIDNEEEKDMNKVVDLWYKRKRDKVIDKYDEMEVEFYNNKYSVVESFNALVEQFNEDLESLYKMDKVTEQFVLKENAPNNVIKYCLDLDKLKEEFEVEYLIKRNEELKEIEEIRIEVEAQLSLSDDLKYQQEVLERYGIINKKTKKIVG